jgi:energy-coupling factor transport system substrate-specific component
MLADTAVVPGRSRRGGGGGIAANRWTSTVTLTAASVVGLAAFLYPFALSRAPGDGEAAAHAGDAPLVFGLLAGLAAVLFLVELASHGMNAKVASALAVLAMAAAVLRLPPLPAGASAFFFLIVIGGYVFGPRFGFLLGSLALFISAFASGGVGPWMPFQMFASGWLGMTSGWLGAFRPRLARRPLVEIAALAVFSALWGFAFGALMNLWFWPYIATGDSVSWRPGLGLAATMQHYWAFYILTSAGWDAWRAIANVLLVLVAGRPALTMLVRFRDRFNVMLDAR